MSGNSTSVSVHYTLTDTIFKFWLGLIEDATDGFTQWFILSTFQCEPAVQAAISAYTRAKSRLSRNKRNFAPNELCKYLAPILGLSDETPYKVLAGTKLGNLTVILTIERRKTYVGKYSPYSRARVEEILGQVNNVTWPQKELITAYINAYTGKGQPILTSRPPVTPLEKPKAKVMRDNARTTNGPKEIIDFETTPRESTKSIPKEGIVIIKSTPAPWAHVVKGPKKPEETIEPEKPVKSQKSPLSPPSIEGKKAGEIRKVVPQKVLWGDAEQEDPNAKAVTILRRPAKETVLIEDVDSAERTDNTALTEKLLAEMKLMKDDMEKLKKQQAKIKVIHGRAPPTATPYVPIPHEMSPYGAYHYGGYPYPPVHQYPPEHPMAYMHASNEEYEEEE